MSPGLIVIIFGAFGLVLAGIGACWLVKKRRFVAAAKRAPGTVVAHETRTSEATDVNNRTVWETYFHPTIEFKDAGGTLRRVTSATGSSPKRYADGAAVTVLFDPDNPEQAEIESFSDLWLGPAILTGIGVVFLAIAIGSWVFKGA